MVIDFHIHYDPEKFIKPFLGPGETAITYFTPEGGIKKSYYPLQFDLPKFVEMMDIGGVDMAVLTSSLGMRSDLEDCRYINDDMKQTEEKYPGRFRGAAHVPPLGGRESFTELRRCRDELGFKGACMHSVVRGVPVDSPELYPFFEAVEELGLFLIVHPGAAEFSSSNSDYDLGRSIGREANLAETTVRLIEGGILDRYPNLKIIMSHLGGHFYAALSRIELYQDKVFWGTQDHPRHSKKSKMPFSWYLDKMFFDTGGIHGKINPVKMALMEIKPQNILFGTDWPFEIREGTRIKAFVEDIRALPLPKSDIDDLLGNNALMLLGML